MRANNEPAILYKRSFIGTLRFSCRISHKTVRWLLHIDKIQITRRLYNRRVKSGVEIVSWHLRVHRVPLRSGLIISGKVWGVYIHSPVKIGVELTKIGIKMKIGLTESMGAEKIIQGERLSHFLVVNQFQTI